MPNDGFVMISDINHDRIGFRQFLMVKRRFQMNPRILRHGRSFPSFQTVMNQLDHWNDFELRKCLRRWQIVGQFEFGLIKNIVPFSKRLTEGVHVGSIVFGGECAIEPFFCYSHAAGQCVFRCQFVGCLESMLVLCFIPHGFYVLIK